MKIVFDTNIIISAFATRGICDEIFEICLNQHEIILSEYIFKECKRIFRKKIKLPNKEINEIITFLRKSCKMVIPHTIPYDTLKDKYDLAIIGTAVTGKADIIITGDKHLLEIKQYKIIKILTPRNFWDYLKTKNQNG